MTWVTIGLSAGTLFGMAIVLSGVLGWANKKFHVDVDERVLAVMDELPGANCGGCGYVGCGEYAEAVVEAYKGDIAKPEQVRNEIQINVGNE